MTKAQALRVEATEAFAALEPLYLAAQVGQKALDAYREAADTAGKLAEAARLAEAEERAARAEGRPVREPEEVALA